jgi:putative tricarboxylic transport membrane protein
VLIGTVIGIIFGVIPGIGSIQGMAILLPFTYAFDPLVSLAMLGAVFSASIYGGSITSILINTPGDPTSAMTVLDGYPLARKGKAGVAIGAATIASLIGGICGVVLLIAAAPPVANLAIKMGAPEFFLLLVFGLALIGTTIKGNTIKGLTAAAIGVLLGTVGMDPVYGAQRFTFGTFALQDGISFAVLTVGLFAMTEAFLLIGQSTAISEMKVTSGIREGLLAGKRYARTLAQSTTIGLGIGVLPGVGATTANLVSYVAAVKTSKHPERFGKGEVEGVIAAEASNNASVGSSLIPTLTLGIPGSAAAAILIGALTIQGLQPGPRLLVDHQPLVYAFFFSLILAQILFAVIGLSLVNVFAKVTQVPVRVLAPLLVVISLFAAYVDRFNTADLIIVVVIGIVGYFLRKHGYPPVPLLMAFVLAPLTETSFEQSMLMGQSSVAIFWERPGSLALLLIAAVVVLLAIARRIRRRVQRASATERSDELAGADRD